MHWNLSSATAASFAMCYSNPSAHNNNSNNNFDLDTLQNEILTSDMSFFIASYFMLSQTVNAELQRQWGCTQT